MTEESRIFISGMFKRTIESFRKCDLVASKQEVDSDWAMNVLRGVIDINGKIKAPKPKTGRFIRK